MAHETRNYALIIGVTDYSDFDRSTGQPPGTSDVPGGRNDARAWLGQCLAMGMAGEQIRVLSTPALSAGDLDDDTAAAAGGVHFAEATRDNLIAGLRWLAGCLSGDGARSGLMTFTGHGAGHDDTSRGLLLCPSDVRASGSGDVDGAVDVLALRRELGAAEAAREWTMVLDCCRAQVGMGRGSALRARLRARLAGLAMAERGEVAQRVLSACRWDKVSVCARFGGKYLGAFTWALLSAMGQWRISEAHGVRWLDASYGQLYQRTRVLLSAVSIAQTPVMSGPFNTARTPFLCPSEYADEHRGLVPPNATPRPMQLDAGDEDYRYYRLQALDGRSGQWLTLAYVFASNEGGTVKLEGSQLDLPAETELWCVDPGAAGALVIGEVTALRVNAYPSQTYASKLALSLADFTVQETAPTVVAFVSVESGASWPANGYPFYSADRARSIPTAVCITAAGDGSSLERVDWYIPQSEYNERNLFSAHPYDSHEVTYDAGDVPDEPAPTWGQATSVLTVRSD